MIDLYTEIKNDATVIFFEENNFGFKASYGAEPLNISQLLHIVGPDQQYNKFSLDYIKLPKSLKRTVSDINKYNRERDHSILEAFHYPLNNQSTNKTIEEIAEIDEFLSKHHPKKKTFDKAKYIEYMKDNIKRKYGTEISTLRINIFGYMNIIGRKDLIQRTTNFIKAEDKNLGRLLEGIINTTAHQTILNAPSTKNIREIIIYDLLQKPKITTFKKTE